MLEKTLEIITSGTNAAVAKKIESWRYGIITHDELMEEIKKIYEIQFEIIKNMQ